MENPRIRTGVIGVGNMGRHHARVYASMSRSELVGVYDNDPARAEQIASAYDCKAYTSVDALLADVDAVSIATPSTLHAEHGLKSLSTGVHCLIEKPLAVSREDCEALASAAKENGMVLHVGHIERFNPVIGQLKKMLPKDLVVHNVNARRMSATSARIKDVDVVMDLMIHDLDITLFLREGRKVVSVDAKGFGGDLVTALLGFDDGSFANVTASRVTQRKIRKLQMSTDSGLFDVDYIDQKLHIYRQSSDPRPFESGQDGTYLLDQSVERVMVRHAEPLQRELTAFIDAIQLGTDGGVSALEALNALELAWAIQKRLADSQQGSTS
jgi:virulence factor